MAFSSDLRICLKSPSGPSGIKLDNFRSCCSVFQVERAEEGLVQTAGKAVSFLKSDTEDCVSALPFARDQIRFVVSRHHHSVLTYSICMGYCGNNIDVNTCAGEELYNTEVRWMEKWRYIISLTIVLSVNGVELHRCTTQPHQWNRPMNITMFVLQPCLWRASLCSESFGVVRKAVTSGSMSSLIHLMMRGGVQILLSAVRHLTGSVAT